METRNLRVTGGKAPNMAIRTSAAQPRFSMTSPPWGRIGPCLAKANVAAGISRRFYCSAVHTCACVARVHL
jgi:hypothetical protein